MISFWGKETKPLPSSVCTNLAPRFGWTILTQTNKGNLPDGEETAIELDLATVPTSKRPEEVNQEEDLETTDNQIGNRETSQNTGRKRIIPDASLSEPDTESMGAARNMDTYPNEDAQSDVTEVSIASHQTSMTVRNARMSNPEEKTTDELSKHVLGKMEKVIRNKDNVEQKDKARALSTIKKVFADTK